MATPLFILLKNSFNQKRHVKEIENQKKKIKPREQMLIVICLKQKDVNGIRWKNIGNREELTVLICHANKHQPF